MGGEKVSPMDAIKRNMLKAFIPQIKENLTVINPFLQQKLSEVVLEDGEAEAVFMIAVDKSGVSHVVTATLDENSLIKRVVSSVTVVDFIESLLKMI